MVPHAQASIIGEIVGTVIQETVIGVGNAVMDGCEALVKAVIPKSKLIDKQPKPIEPQGIKLMDEIPAGSAEKVFAATRVTPFAEIYSLVDLQDLARPGSSLYTHRGMLLFHSTGDFEMRAIPDQLIPYFLQAGVITNVHLRLANDLVFEEQ